MNLSAANERLGSILAETGLGGDEAIREKLKGVLEPLSKWIQAQPAHVLRATQVLLLDTDRPKAHLAQEMRIIAKVVQDVWMTAADKPGHVVLNQLTILSLLGEAQAQWSSGIPSLLRASHGAIIRSSSFASYLSDWWSRVQDFLHPDPSQQRSPSPAETKAVNQALAGIEPNAGNPQVALQQVVPVLKGLKEATQQLWRSQAAGDPPTLLLLWWGQARYSTTQRRSLRHFTPAQRLTIAAREVCDLSQHLPFNPTAAYLVEVLHALGDAWDETRPLRDWLNDLHATQKLLGPLPSNPSEGGATALPSLTLLAGTPVDDLGEKCQIDLDTPYTRADWATWLLGELTLARVLAP